MNPIREKKLDFVIIGAAKSGTTSLFEYLAEHPQIHMPARKELSFFSNPEHYAKGMDWYYETWFAGGDPGKQWGEASPQYMYFPSVAARIHTASPDVRVIAILRNPIDRAFAHYRMGLRKAVEKESFTESIGQLMQRGAGLSDEALKKDGFSVDYLRYGLYGAILRNYFDVFPAEQIRVYFFEELTNETARVVRELYQWLGVDPSHSPKSITQVFNSGGVLRFPLLSRALDNAYNRARSSPALKAAVTGLFSRNTVTSYYRWVTNELLVKKEKSEGPGARDRERLALFYADDVASLEAMLGRRVPWPEFAAQSTKTLRACA